MCQLGHDMSDISDNVAVAVDIMSHSFCRQCNVSCCHYILTLLARHSSGLYSDAGYFWPLRKTSLRNEIRFGLDWTQWTDRRNGHKWCVLHCDICCCSFDTYKLIIIHTYIRICCCQQCVLYMSLVDHGRQWSSRIWPSQKHVSLCTVSWRCDILRCRQN